MAEKSREILKSYFETFDLPTESNFTDLIDSFLLKTGDNYITDAVVPYNGNQDIESLPTSGSYQDTGLALLQKPVFDTRINVLINGETLPVGDGVLTVDTYFSRDNGSTALPFTDLEVGDKLYYNGTICHIGDLTSNDRIWVNYSYLKPVAVTVGPIPVAPTLLNLTYYVDAINGDDLTGIQGNRSLPFLTILGAETQASSGDLIHIVTDIKECCMGKNGLTYIIDPGLRVWYPSSDPTPPGLANAHLWSDEGKGNINIKVYGGTHEESGDWYGEFNRGIVANYNSSDIRIYAEQIKLTGDDGFLVSMYSEGHVELHATGDITSGYSGIYCSNALEAKVILKAGGKISGYVRMIQEWGTAGATIVLTAGTMIESLGHGVTGLRGFLYCNQSLTTKVCRWTLNAPLLKYYDENPQLGSGNGGFIFTWSNSKIKLDINCDEVRMSNSDPVTYPNEAAFFSLWKTASTEIEINMNVRRLILGVAHQLDDSSNGPDKINARVKWIGNTEIIFLTPLVESGNAFDCDLITHIFESTTKIILNPDAITAGQKALGGAISNNAFIIDKVISNGDIYDNTFVNSLDGVDYATGIDNLIMNNSTLIDWDNYKNL